MIEVRNLTKVFQKDNLEVRVLEDISVTINEGEFVA